MSMGYRKKKELVLRTTGTANEADFWFSTRAMDT